MGNNLQKLPRVYLDTNVLLDIGDRRVDHEELAALVGAMDRVGAVLVVSSAHFLDAASGRSEVRSRLVAAIEQFPRAGFVRSNPWRHERGAFRDVREGRVPPAELPDLDLYPFRLAFADPTPASAYAGTAPIFSYAAERQREFQRLRETGFESDKLVNDLLRLSSVATRARSPREAAQLLNTTASLEELARIERELVPHFDVLRLIGEITAAEAARTGAPLRAVVMNWVTDQAVTLVPEPWYGPHDRDQWLAAARCSAPGWFLVAQVARHQGNNPHRVPKRSDAVDRAHVCHLPYVDVGTVDRETHEIVSRALDELEVGRKPTLVRYGNGVLSMIARAVEDRTGG